MKHETAQTIAPPPKDGDAKIPNVLTDEWLKALKNADYDRSIFGNIAALLRGEEAIPVQSNLFYYWQNIALKEFKWAHAPITLKTAQKVVNGVRKLFGMPHDVAVSYKAVTLPDGSVVSAAQGATTVYSKITKCQTIVVGEDEARAEAVLLHEACHSVINTAGYNKYSPGHGEMFARLYIEVLHTLKGVDKEPLVDLAKKMGLQVADTLPENLKMVKK